MKPFDLIFRHHESGSFLTIEDDGRVAYAYFHSSSGEILGDVWQCNRCRTPSDPEWSNKTRAPFANPSAFARDNVGFPLPRKRSEVTVRWSQDPCGPLMAEIFAGDILIAGLCAGATPGWSIAAKKDGPLAKTLPAAIYRPLPDGRDR